MTVSTRISLALALAGGLAAMAGAASAADKPAFVSGGKFAVCTDASFPPMEYFEKSGDKLPVGFDVDFMNEIAQAGFCRSKSSPWTFPDCCLVEAKRCTRDQRHLRHRRAQKKFDAVSYLARFRFLQARRHAARRLAGGSCGQTIALQTGTSFVKHSRGEQGVAPGGGA